MPPPHEAHAAGKAQLERMFDTTARCDTALLEIFVVMR